MKTQGKSKEKLPRRTLCNDSQSMLRLQQKHPLRGQNVSPLCELGNTKSRCETLKNLESIIADRIGEDIAGRIREVLLFGSVSYYYWNQGGTAVRIGEQPTASWSGGLSATKTDQNGVKENKDLALGQNRIGSDTPIRTPPVHSSDPNPSSTSFSCMIAWLFGAAMTSSYP